MTDYVDTPQSSCLFAVAVGDITPPVGIYHRMWGAAVHDRAEGVHLPLRASVLWFEPLHSDGGSEQQVLIALDHCLLGAREVDELRAAVAVATGIAADSITVTFSHTHAAGLLTLDRIDQPGGDLIPAYLAKTNEVAAELGARAKSALRPAHFVYSTGRCDLAAHRDYLDREHGAFVCGYNPHQAADDTVLTARVTSDEGELLATIVNYACHPTTLAWDNRLISPDYPGPMRDAVESATGAPCVFLQGASGDLGPRHGYVGDIETAQSNGRRLGYAALAALEAAPPANMRFEYQGPVTSGATLGVWDYAPLPADRRQQVSRWEANRAEAAMNYRTDLPTHQQASAELARWQSDEAAAQAAGDGATARDCRAMAERQRRLLARLSALPPGDVYPLSVVAWRMGDAVWLAVQGEPYNWLQTSLRARFPNNPLGVATIANGWGPSYLPTADVYGKGLYQETIAVLQPGCLEHLCAVIGDRIVALLDL